MILCNPIDLNFVVTGLHLLSWSHTWESPQYYSSRRSAAPISAWQFERRQNKKKRMHVRLLLAIASVPWTVWLLTCAATIKLQTHLEMVWKKRGLLSQCRSCTNAYYNAETERWKNIAVHWELQNRIAEWMPTTTKRSGRLLDAPTVSTTLANNWIVETGLKSRGKTVCIWCLQWGMCISLHAPTPILRMETLRENSLYYVWLIVENNL